jgi:hypothetical protein
LSKEEQQPRGLEYLEEALNSQTKTVNIRLREGEHQFSLARAIASSELELHFPDVKELVRKLYGEKRIENQQFLNMIQTILKKMEKSGVIKILPKEKPWELQRYALLSFRFEDVEKSKVILATEDEIKQTKRLLHSRTSGVVTAQQSRSKILPSVLLISLVVVSFALIVWALIQSPVSLPLFVSAFCLAAVSSTILGILVSRRN